MERSALGPHSHKTGVTVVQYRDKHSETRQMIETAKELHKITRAANIPLLINDRIDVAQAAKADGVHIGQEDVDLATAREILGPHAIIGVTASSVSEAVEAAKAGADYLGVGTVFATTTKENAKSIIGVAGTREILDAMVKEGCQDVKTVCIGSINKSNAQRVLFQTATKQKRLDGVAVVSAIMAADDAKEASMELSELVRAPPPFAAPFSSKSASPRKLSPSDMLAQIPGIIKNMAERKPLAHNMTNLVVQNFAANVALAVGSSPIMAGDGNEATDLAALGGSLVINMGSVTPEMRTNYVKALSAYNAVGGPVLFDPVGAGATQQRREGVKVLMNAGYFDVIKGNEGEIRTVSGASGVRQHGVDSGASQLSLEQRIELVRDTATREHNVILMTGSTDIVSDGTRTILIRNGHTLLGDITGSGCTLGTTIASVLAVYRDDKLLAALAGILLYEIAAEHAVLKAQGPGSFVPAFIDELYRLRELCKREDGTWLEAAKIEIVP